MSKNSSKAGSPTRPTPPEHSRFKPGQSGNPKGRPKKAAAAGKLNPLERAFEEAIIQEGARLVTVMDGGKQAIIPASQAVLRATFVTAIKGSTHAQRTVVSALIDIERRTQKAHADYFGRAVEAKADLAEGLHKWIAAGRREEDIPFHPSDIVIDPQSLDVRNYIPLTLEELGAREKLIENRDEILRTIAIGELGLAEFGENPDLSSSVDWWRNLLAEVNGHLPPRLRKERYKPMAAVQRGRKENAADRLGTEISDLPPQTDDASPEDNDYPS